MSFFFLFFLHSICHSFAPFHSTPFHSHHSSKRPPCHCAIMPQQQHQPFHTVTPTDTIPQSQHLYQNSSELSSFASHIPM
ncbi:MAG: hypothetical protein J3R72DRAFT_454130, partial [Linnemannia gamsii]